MSSPHRWWTSPQKCPDMDKAKPSKTTSLSIEKVGGVFIILGVGVGLAIVAALLDYLVRIRPSADTTKNRVRIVSHYVFISRGYYSTLT